MSGDLMQGVEFSHFLFKKHIEQGAHVIDATAGNGHDTLFLANLVGSKGFVYAFDIQKEAVRHTKNKLENNNLSQRVNVIHDGHENLKNYIDEPVSGIIFNLGYLPHGNKNIITKPKTTIPAVKAGLDLLENKGLLVLVIYVGHPGRQKELDSLMTYSRNLNSKLYNVLHYHFLNQNQPPAELLAIKKRNNE